MTTFRCKTKKQANTSTRETLHSKHLDMVKQFKSSKKIVAIKKKQQRDLQAELVAVKKLADAPEKVSKIIDLEEKLNVVQQEIAKLDENEDEDQYYLTNGDLIFQYFQNISEIANAPSTVEIHAPGESSEVEFIFEDPKLVDKPKSVMDFLMPTVTTKKNLAPIPEAKPFATDYDEDEKGMCGDLSDVESVTSVGDTASVVDSLTDDPEKPRGHGLQDFVQRTENFKRAKMLDKYMSNIDATHVIKLDRVKSDKCPSCHTEMTVNQNEGLSECLHCGHSEMIKVDSDKRSYKEASNTEMSYIAYKRINHFDFTLECNSGLKVSYPLVACAA